MRPVKASRVRLRPDLMRSRRPIDITVLSIYVYDASFSSTETILETPFSSITTP